MAYFRTKTTFCYSGFVAITDENLKLLEDHIDIVHTMSYLIFMQIYKWNNDKNSYLARTRGITFEEIVERISSGGKVREIEHLNKKKYPNQKIMIVEINAYAYLVLFVVEGETVFLKTIIPSRKATKEYLGDKYGGQ